MSDSPGTAGKEIRDTGQVQSEGNFPPQWQTAIPCSPLPPWPSPVDVCLGQDGLQAVVELEEGHVLGGEESCMFQVPLGESPAHKTPLPLISLLQPLCSMDCHTQISLHPKVPF